MAKTPSLPKPAPKRPGILTKTPQRPKSEREAFLTLAKARFAQAEKADEDQRAREIAALRFYSGDQWPAEVKQALAFARAGAEPELATVFDHLYADRLGAAPELR